MGDNGRPGANKKDHLADYRKTMESRAWVAVEHGQDTAAFFRAVKEEGLSIPSDEEKIRKLEEASKNEASSRGISSTIRPDGAGGLEMSVEYDARASKETGINAAIKSLGDRKGQDPKAISKALKTALRERDLGLDDETRLDIASILATGEEVIVGADSDSNPGADTSSDDRGW